MDLSAQTQEYLSLLSENAYLQAVLVVLVSLVLARIADLVIVRVFASLTSRTRTDLDDKIIQLMHRPVFVTVALLGLQVALALVIPEQYRAIGRNSLYTLIVLVWLSFGLRLTTLLLGWMTREERRFEVVQPATAPLFDIAVKVVLVGVAAYFILDAWGKDISAWLASAGILGLAIGLAAQETLGNLFAGVSILADSPYKVGDYIVLDNAERGEVVKIGLRSTRILTRDQIEVTVPNSVIAQSKIINESGGPTPGRRVKIPVGVAYGTDIDRLEQILLDVANEEPLVSPQPEPRVQFATFGASSLDFELRCWIDDPENRGRVTNNLNGAIYKALNREGIEIPFPQQDVYIREMPSLDRSGPAQKGGSD